jgi:CheY-like chemotaxis protein
MTPISSLWSRRSWLECEAPIAGRTRVLVVEDELIVCAIVAEALDEAGFEVLTATSAEEAEVILSQEVVDVLFTDIDLGGRDGCELASRARAMQPGLSIVFASGRSRRCLRDRLPARASFLAKPYRLLDLIREVGPTATEPAHD